MYTENGSLMHTAQVEFIENSTEVEEGSRSRGEASTGGSFERRTTR